VAGSLELQAHLLHKFTLRTAGVMCPLIDVRTFTIAIYP